MLYNDYLQWHQLALRILGLWPIPGSSPLYFCYRVVFLGLFCVSFNLLEFLNLFFIYDELRAFASDLSWFLLHLPTSFKIVVFLSKIKDIQKICGRFGTRSVNLEVEEEEIFAAAVKKSFRYLAVYYTCSAVVLLNGFVAPIYRDEGRKGDSLPYYTYVFCDVDTSPCYEIAYTYQIISTCCGCFVLIHCDNLYLVLVMLCCSEFRILHRSIETIAHRAEKRVSTQSLEHNMYRAANWGLGGKKFSEKIDRESLRLGTNCVKHHHAILQVSKDLEEMYNLLLLAQFLSHLIQLCFQMFLVTEVSALSFDGVSMIAFVISMVIEVYLFCECGNEIETESIKVSEAAYNAQWMTSSEPVKKTLLLMMLRAQRPVQFTFGKFGNLSLRTLVSVLKGSFSYFMVLRGIQ